MARQLKVSRDEGVEAALMAFWQHGYGALGTRQLEAETGITRFTLQTAHGGKMALYAKALDRYLDRMEAELIPAMADGTLETLARWFEMRADPSRMPEGACWGCMMIAAINEFGGSEPEINARAARFQEMLRNGFGGALSRIGQAGGLARDVDVPAAVEVLMAASIGLNVIVRGAGDCAAGADTGAGIARLVRGWAPPAQ